MQDKTSATQETPFSESQEPIELANELWVLVFSFLDPETLLSKLPLISKRFSLLANDSWLWKKLFETLFADDLPPPLLSSAFDWRTEFITLYRKQYGSLSPQARRCVFLITIGAIQEISATQFSIQDFEAEQFSLIRRAAQFKQQTTLNHFYLHAQQTLENHDDKKKLYWATLCNQQDAVRTLLNKRPDLINETIFEENKTVTMLAALAGHIELMKELIAHPSNQLLQFKKGFKKLHQCIIRNEQLSTVNDFLSFIQEQEEINTSPLLVDSLEPSEIKKRSLAFSILNEAENLPSNITLAARYNSVTVFKALTNQAQQRCIQLQECLGAESSPLYTSINPEPDEIELLQLVAWSEAKQAYMTALSDFDWEMHQAMLEATKFGHVDIIKYALDNNFFAVDRRLLIDQQTLLYRAVLSKQPTLVQFLLKKQANPKVALTMLLSEHARLQSEDYSEMIALLLETTEEASAKRKFEPPEKQKSKRKFPKFTEDDSPNPAGRYRMFANSNQETTEVILPSQSPLPNTATKETEIEDKDDSATYSW